jgi:glycosyltransferase involved in cell wall biosynthesis
VSQPFPIAYVAGQFPLRSETFVWREVRELRRRGWPVHTFGLRPPTEQTPEGLRDLREATRDVYADGTPRPGLAGLADVLLPGEPTPWRDRLKLPVQAAAGKRLAKWLREANVQHVHAHFAHAPATVAAYAAGAAGISFSFTGHANDLFQRRQLLTRKLQRAAFVGCISEWHRELYRSLHADGTYEVIRCGVPTGDYDVPPPTPEPGKLRVLTLCRLVGKKGVDTLLRAAATVPGVEVTVAGDGPMRTELETMAPADTRFLGPVDAGQVPALLAEHDAFALPCRPDENGDRDGIPVVLMEAMAARRAVVAGDLPAIRELVENGVTGRLVAVEDVSQDEQIAATARVLRDWLAAFPYDFADAGRRRVEQEFSLAANVDRLEAMLYAAVTR